MATCPKCGHTNRDTARFCANCSGPLITTPSSPVTPGRICPKCQTGNSSTARFCSKCGQPLAVPFSQTPPPITPVYPSPVSVPSGATGMLPTNACVANRYIIVQKVGQGGMGAVYEAVDTRLNARCALKEMSSAHLTTMAERQVALASFEKEARILAALSHPNLPKVSDHFDDGGRHYMVMEFIEGQTLDKWIENKQPMPENEVKAVAGQICDVLEYLHSQQPPIIFRDMKPGNIMLQRDGRVKLIDFGIVRNFDPKKTKDTQMLGTPGYAAPEAYGGTTNAQSDIFSLGITLYCLLTAKEPPQTTMGFNPLPDLAHCSTDFKQVISKAVQTKRDDRWSSAAVMRQTIIGGGSIQGIGSAGNQTPLSQPPISTPQSTPVGGGIRHMTRRLTQTISLRMQQMSGQQLAGLAAALIIGIPILTWLVGPWIAQNLPWLWDFLPIYFAAGPFAYAVSNRKGAAILVHTPLHLLVGWLTWYETFNFGPQLLAGLAAGGGMEVVLSQAKKENRIWYYVAAPAIGVALAMGVLTSTSNGVFDFKEIFGAGLAGAIGYAAGEIVWGVRKGIETN